MSKVTVVVSKRLVNRITAEVQVLGAKLPICGRTYQALVRLQKQLKTLQCETNNEGTVKVHLKWGPRFFIFGVLIDICLLMLMYWTDEKEVAFFCHKCLSYSGIWTGTRLFRGIPMTRTVLIFVDAYVVLFSGIQAFVVGLIVDLFREKSKIR